MDIFSAVLVTELHKLRRQQVTDPFADPLDSPEWRDLLRFAARLRRLWLACQTLVPARLFTRRRAPETSTPARTATPPCCAPGAAQH